MDMLTIFGTQLILSIFVYALIAKWYVVPWLADKPMEQVLIALRNSWVLALPLVWVFNVVGSLDLLNALRQAEAIPYLEATWYIPTFFVPLLLVTHVMIFSRLLRLSRNELNLATS